MTFGCYKISPVVASFIFFLLFGKFQSVKSNDINHPKDEANYLKHVRAQLKKINKSAIKTIQSSDGDIINCVLSHQQPAFNHPLLKGQKPWVPPQRPKGYTSIHAKKFQIGRMHDESCPEGTIPIKRISEQDILRIGSIQRFGRKITTQDLDNKYHEYAYEELKEGEYYGATTRVSVWSPSIERSSEFSTSQMWIEARKAEDIDTIKVGWQVYPDLYGDELTRFFIYWAGGSNETNRCYNLICSGFVQTSDKIVLGGAISPVSSYDDDQIEMFLRVWKEPTRQVWWLENDDEVIGYWPYSLFTVLKDGPITVRLGGEVLNQNVLGHTTTGMGSGYFAAEGYGNASYFRSIYLEDKVHNITSISDIDVASKAPNCYSIEKRNTSEWGVHFYYGGPGQNPKCS